MRKGNSLVVIGNLPSINSTDSPQTLSTNGFKLVFNYKATVKHKIPISHKIDGININNDTDALRKSLTCHQSCYAPA